MTTTTIEIRKCRLCRADKPVTDFEKDKRLQTGYSNRCKTCKSSSISKALRSYHRMKARAEADGMSYDVTVKDIEKLFLRFDDHCAYCGDEPEDQGSVSIDHVIATSNGGSYNVENLLISCISCNRKKGNLPLAEFYFRNMDVFTENNFILVVHYLAVLNNICPTEYRSLLLEEQADYLMSEMSKQEQAERRAI